jgi:hypothetical protein
MIHRPSRLTIVALASVAVVGFVCCAHRRPLVGTQQTAVVDSAGTANPADISLSLGGDGALSAPVIWVPYQPGHTVKITFSVQLFPRQAGGEPPFAGPNGKDLVYGPSAVAYSGQLNQKLKAVFDANPTLTQLVYPYDSAIGGVAQDGRIIIMK